MPYCKKWNECKSIKCEHVSCTALECFVVDNKNPQAEQATASCLSDLLCADKDMVINRLRGQLQNCVNHLERAKRRTYNGKFDECIEQANRALYETAGV